MSTFTVAIILFSITYILLFSLPKYRSLIAFASASVFSVWLSLLSEDVSFNFNDIIGAIDFNVLMMIFGTMGIVSLFIESKMPMKIADILLSKFKNVRSAIIAMAVMAGVISAFIDNVATVLMLAPIALAVCKKQNISPISSIIAISISSNLQGAATLVGDTTSILLGSYANMNFFDFFVFHNKPSIFWAVEIGAFLTVLLLFFIFRKETQQLKISEKTVVKDYSPTIIIISTVLLLILASFIKEPSEGFWNTIYQLRNGIICLSLLIIGLIINITKNKSLKTAKETLKEIDYDTLLLLASLFIIISAITKAGVIDKLSELLVSVGGNNLLLMYTTIVFASVLISAFVDNIPYVLTMLPVMTHVASSMNTSPYVLYFGLLVGATLGGNITPIGASANIAGIGILKKEGHTVKTKDFMKISIPFTLTAVLSGYAIVWLFWGSL